MSFATIDFEDLLLLRSTPGFLLKIPACEHKETTTPATVKDVTAQSEDIAAPHEDAHVVEDEDIVMQVQLTDDQQQALNASIARELGVLAATWGIVEDPAAYPAPNDAVLELVASPSAPTMQVELGAIPDDEDPSDIEQAIYTSITTQFAAALRNMARDPNDESFATIDLPVTVATPGASATVSGGASLDLALGSTRTVATQGAHDNHEEPASKTLGTSTTPGDAPPGTYAREEDMLSAGSVASGSGSRTPTTLPTPPIAEVDPRVVPQTPDASMHILLDNDEHFADFKLPDGTQLSFGPNAAPIPLPHSDDMQLDIDPFAPGLLLTGASMPFGVDIVQGFPMQFDTDDQAVYAMPQHHDEFDNNEVDAIGLATPGLQLADVEQPADPHSGDVLYELQVWYEQEMRRLHDLGFDIPN